MRRIATACWLSLLVCGVAHAAKAPPPREPALGAWRGSAVREGARLDLRVRLVREQGALRATLSSADLLLLEQPLGGVELAGRRVRFATPDEPPLRFDGVLEGDSIRGSVLVPSEPGHGAAGRDAPGARFALGRSGAPPAPPYATREVAIPRGAVRLAATLRMPPGAGAHAGVVLLPDESSGRRGDLAFHADRFARAGLAVLVFDRRGTGASTGDDGAATYDQLAGDAAAAVAFLRERPGVDRARVGVWGVGQGALLGAMVAARVPELRFLVAVSAPGVPVGESAAYQDSMHLAAAGFDAADIQRTVSLDRRLLAWLRDGRDSAELSALLDEASGTPWRRESSLPARLPAAGVLDAWRWRGRTMDPETLWRAVRAPVLVVHGAADERLLARPNAKAVERALRKGGNRDATVRTFPAADHLVRTRSGARGAWDWPRAAAGYLELVTGWVLEHVR